MDLQRAPKVSLPYKNPHWAERKREMGSFKNPRAAKTIKNIRAQQATLDSGFNYYSIDAPPSNTPAKPKYCDITGFPTKYKDSVSGLFFYDKAVSQYIKMLSKPTTEQFLLLRGEVPIDKMV